jgi:hypothetical protein
VNKYYEVLTDQILCTSAKIAYDLYELLKDNKNITGSYSDHEQSKI